MAKRVAKKKADLTSMKFEDAIAQLEELIEQIESGEVGLEQSLEQYEHGMALIKHCQGVLATAEKKIALPASVWAAAIAC